MNHLLDIIIFLPMISSIFLFFITRKQVRVFAIVVSAIELFLAICLWVNFQPLNVDMQFSFIYPLIEEYGINYFVGVDGISIFLIILNAFIFLICFIFADESKDTKGFYASLLLLQSIITGVFSPLDVMLFYVFWELSLVPILYLIGNWGGEKRIYASIKFFLYTFSGSILMLVGILYFGYLYYQTSGFWSFSLLDWYNLYQMPINMQFWLFLAFFAGIAIKIPIFPFHTWLPYAHGQAPTVGSAILASVLLKMGTYALIRFLLPLFPDISYQALFPIGILCVIMIIYGGMVAFAQKDIKQVIAYSSIAHMGIIVLSIFTLNDDGINGGVFYMISHGVTSATLFILVGIIYERFHTKDIASLGGIAKEMPLATIIFAIALFSNIGLPLSIGFVGEFLSLFGIFSANIVLGMLSATGIVIGSVYMLVLFKNVFLGEKTAKKVEDLNKRELCTLIPLTIVIIWLGIYPKPLLLPIGNSVSAMIENIQNKTIIYPKEMMDKENILGQYIKIFQDSKEML